MCAFYALCRISELTGKPYGHTLQAEGLKFKQNPLRCIITFNTFKHSTTAQSVTIYPQLPEEFCPVSEIQAYMQVRPSGAHHLFTAEWTISAKNTVQPYPQEGTNCGKNQPTTSDESQFQDRRGHICSQAGLLPLHNPTVGSVAFQCFSEIY